MLLMGDEVRRTQHGNNNGYCQDNELSWFDWSLCTRHADLLDYVRKLVRFRRELNIFRDGHGLSLIELLQYARIEWHGVELFSPDKHDSSRSLALTMRGASEAFHVMANFYWEPLDFALPPPPRRSATGWRRVLDTALPAPNDFCMLVDASPVAGERYQVGPRTVVLLATEMRTPPPRGR
jgi:isoamylase